MIIHNTRRAALAQLGTLFASFTLASCEGGGSDQPASSAPAPLDPTPPVLPPPAADPVPPTIAKQYMVTATDFYATDFRIAGSGLMAGYRAGSDMRTHVFLKDSATLTQVDLPGVASTPMLAAMNRAGDLVLVARRAGDGFRRTFLVRRDGAIKSIGEFSPSDTDVAGAAVNGSGLVIGQSTPANAAAGSSQGFVDGGPFGLLALPFADTSWVQVLSERGWVAGTSSTIGAFVWSAEFGTRTIPPLDVTEVFTRLAAINSSMVIGYFTLPPYGRNAVSNYRAWFWTPTRGKQLLSDSQGGVPTGVNESGLVVGTTPIVPNVFQTPASRAFAWTEQSGFRELPSLGARTYSAANALNAAGLIGGYASFGGYFPDQVATVWTLADGPVDLNTVIQSPGIPTLIDVAGITDAGVIAAVGNETDRRIYLLTPAGQ